MKRALDIETLLQWAYREELPKNGVALEKSSFDQISSYAVPIDDDGPCSFPAALGAPHPDALAIEGVVRLLPDKVVIDWHQDRALLLGDFGLAACDVGDRRPYNMKALVMMHAKMATRPDWRTDPPRLVRVHGANGKPVVIGVTAGRRYRHGAYCPLQFDPPLGATVFARAEYLIWRTGIDLVRESLRDGVLRDHAPMTAAAPLDPWRVGENPPRRILETVEHVSVQSLSGRASGVRTRA